MLIGALELRRWLTTVSMFLGQQQFSRKQVGGRVNRVVVKQEHQEIKVYQQFAKENNQILMCK